jgi:predicted membrane channel-forming protein YqfA (hemolysin III family)
MLSLRGHHYRFDQVPGVFKESFIIHGYRHPKSSAKQCILSIFQGNNETLNVWTHFLPIWYFLWRFITLSHVMDFWNDPYCCPLLALLMTVCAYPFFSAAAHAFNTMSVRARHVCFMIDYAGLSLYGYGTAVVYNAYAFPDYLFDSWYADIYLPVALVLCILCTFFSSLSRFMAPGLFLKVCRLGAFALPCIWASLPVLFRVVFCFVDVQGCFEVSVMYHSWQFFFVITAAILYATHMPERLIPGKFDIIGHSHQLFHCCSVLASNCQINAVLSDHMERKTLLENHNTVPSFMYSIIGMSAIAVINTLIVIVFAIKLHYTHFPEDDLIEVPATNSHKCKCH